LGSQKDVIVYKLPSIMKSTKVQTLGRVALHATTDCTNDTSIVGLGPLNWAIV